MKAQLNPDAGVGTRSGASVPGRRFSIVISSYNQRDFITAAVDSALSQRHPLKEIIVVDDGSTDGSGERLEQYGDAIQLVRFSNNRGVIEARNHGAARATGDYLAFLDGDDLFMPWALGVYERIVTERTPKMIIGKNLSFQGSIPLMSNHEAPRKIECVEYKTFFSKDRPVVMNASTFVIERQAFRDVGGWSPGIFQMDCQDLCSKLGISGRTIILCSPPTVLYRIHTANTIHAVRPFLRMAHRLIDKERAGEYAGGREHRFERYAWFGGLWFYWTKAGLRAGFYKDAVKLAARGRSMILAAVVRRCAAHMKGRRPIETFAFTPDAGATGSDDFSRVV